MQLIALLLENDFLRFFIDDFDSDVGPDTAYSWIITAIVVSIVGAALVFGFKALRKSTAGTLLKENWTRRRTWLSIFVGLFPIFVALLISWYVSRDFFNFIQFGGLLKGVVFAWVIYIVLMVIGHLVSPWRRELI